MAQEHYADTDYKGTSYVQIVLHSDEDEAKTCGLSVQVRSADGDWTIPAGWDEKFRFNGTRKQLWSDVSASLYMQLARFFEAVLLEEGRLSPSYQWMLMRMSGDDFQKTADDWDGIIDPRPYTDAEMEAKIYG